jgi:hypothetical protein
MSILERGGYKNVSVRERNILEDTRISLSELKKERGYEKYGD